MENQEYKWRQRKKRNTKITIWVVLVIILSVGGTVVYEGMKESDPLKVAENYFKQEVGVSDYKVDTGSRSLNENNQFVQEYTFSYTADGKEVSQTINMIQQNEKKYGLFEQWSLTAAETGTRDLELIAPAGSQVLLNGVPASSGEIKEDENLSPGAVCYQLTGVETKNCKIQVNGLPFDSYEGVLDENSSVIDIRDQLVVGENAQTQMSELGKTMINELFTAAVENKKAEDLSELFDNAPNKENLYKAITDNLYKDGVLQADTLTFENFQATFGEVYYPGKEEDSYIGMEMKLSYTCSYEPAAETETEESTEEQSTEETDQTESETEQGSTNTHSAEKEATFYFKYQNGQCIVTSIEVPGAI